MNEALDLMGKIEDKMDNIEKKKSVSISEVVVVNIFRATEASVNERIKEH